MSRETLVVPVVFPDPELYPIHDYLVKELENFEILLLGYWEVAEDDDPEEVREARKTEAEATLYEIAAEFSKEGAPVDIQLHFGSGEKQERDFPRRLVEGTDASGVLLVPDQTLLRRGLVAVRDERDRPRLMRLLRHLNPETTLELELYHAAESDEAAASAEELLTDMFNELHEEGFPYVELTKTVEVTDDPEFGIIRKARDHEFIVMGETEQPDIEDQTFGETYEYIAEEAELPILLGRAVGE